MHFDILITNAGLLLQGNHPWRIAADSYLAIADGRIHSLGQMKELPESDSATKRIDATGNLIMPGLINCHCHAAMTLFRGLADDLPLTQWLHQHIFPAEAKWVTPEMVYWCSKLAAAEMILSGTTTVADGYFFEKTAARAFRDSGLRAVAAQGVLDFPAPGVPDPAGNIAAAAEFLDAWHDDELITPAVFCHAPYTCSPATLERGKELAHTADRPFFIHLAETADEVRQIHERYGKSPVAHLAHLGVLDQDTIGVHCVHLDDADIAILQHTGAAVATCPESNMKLASGTAPVTALLNAGVTVGIGTDSAASNNDLDLFGEMGSLARLHKAVQMNPTVLPAGQVLAMATSGGARAIGLGGKTGELRPGMLADCIIVNLDQPHLTPFHGPDLLVYAGRGSDVISSIIHGRLVMEHRRLLTMDLDEVLRRVRTLAESIRRI